MTIGRSFYFHQKETSLKVRPDLLNVHGAAQKLGISAWTIRELIWAGRLPCVRVGRLVRIDPKDIESFIENNKFVRERKNR